MNSAPDPLIASHEPASNSVCTAENPSLIQSAPITVGFIPATDQALSNEITRLAGHINAAQYRFLKLLAALVERHAWGGDSGMKSPAHWLNYYCGIDLGAAREKVRVAKCLSSLPLIDQAFSTGAISYSKVRAMTRAATPENEEYLLNIAKNGTTAHMEMLIRKYHRSQRLNSSSQDKAQYAAREFSWFHDDDGMLVFKGRLCAEDGAVFLKAMDAVLDQLREDKSGHAGQTPAAENPKNQSADAEDETGSGESSDTGGPAQTVNPHKPEPAAARAGFPIQAETEIVSAETSLLDFTDGVNQGVAKETFTQKRADALVLMSEHLLATLVEGEDHGQRQISQLKPLSGGDKYQVMVHIDATTELNDHYETRQACCQLDDHGFQLPLPAKTMRRLSCDASLVTVVEDSEGNVLNVGRKTRSIPPAIRRALTVRDQGCRFPGCCESRFVDAHHVRHWCDGGETSLDNLVLLCRYHHRLLHQEGFSIKVENAPGEKHMKTTRKVRTSHLVFTSSTGQVIEQALFPQFKSSDLKNAHFKPQVLGADKLLAVESENGELGLEIDSQTAITAWRGEAMDYGLAVDALIRRSGCHQH